MDSIKTFYKKYEKYFNINFDDYEIDKIIITTMHKKSNEKVNNQKLPDPINKAKEKSIELAKIIIEFNEDEFKNHNFIKIYKNNFNDNSHLTHFKYQIYIDFFMEVNNIISKIKEKKIDLIEKIFNLFISKKSELYQIYINYNLYNEHIFNKNIIYIHKELIYISSQIDLYNFLCIENYYELKKNKFDIIEKYKNIYYLNLNKLFEIINNIEIKFNYIHQQLDIDNIDLITQAKEKAIQSINKNIKLVNDLENHVKFTNIKIVDNHKKILEELNNFLTTISNTNNANDIITYYSYINNENYNGFKNNLENIKRAIKDIKNQIKSVISTKINEFSDKYVLFDKINILNDNTNIIENKNHIINNFLKSQKENLDKINTELENKDISELTKIQKSVNDIIKNCDLYFIFKEIIEDEVSEKTKINEIKKKKNELEKLYQTNELNIQNKNNYNELKENIEKINNKLDDIKNNRIQAFDTISKKTMFQYINNIIAKVSNNRDIVKKLLVDIQELKIKTEKIIILLNEELDKIKEKKDNLNNYKTKIENLKNNYIEKDHKNFNDINEKIQKLINNIKELITEIGSKDANDKKKILEDIQNKIESDRIANFYEKLNIQIEEGLRKIIFILENKDIKIDEIEIEIDEIKIDEIMNANLRSFDYNQKFKNSLEKLTIIYNELEKLKKNQIKQEEEIKQDTENIISAPDKKKDKNNKIKKLFANLLSNISNIKFNISHELYNKLSNIKHNTNLEQYQSLNSINQENLKSINDFFIKYIENINDKNNDDIKRITLKKINYLRNIINKEEPNQNQYEITIILCYYIYFFTFNGLIPIDSFKYIIFNLVQGQIKISAYDLCNDENECNKENPIKYIEDDNQKSNQDKNKLTIINGLKKILSIYNNNQNEKFGDILLLFPNSFKINTSIIDEIKKEKESNEEEEQKKEEEDLFNKNDKNVNKDIIELIKEEKNKEQNKSFKYTYKENFNLKKLDLNSIEQILLFLKINYNIVKKYADYLHGSIEVKKKEAEADAREAEADAREANAKDDAIVKEKEKAEKDAEAEADAEAKKLRKQNIENNMKISQFKSFIKDLEFYLKLKKLILEKKSNADILNFINPTNYNQDKIQVQLQTQAQTSINNQNGTNIRGKVMTYEQLKKEIKDDDEYNDDEKKEILSHLNNEDNKEKIVNYYERYHTKLLFNSLKTIFLIYQFKKLILYHSIFITLYQDNKSNYLENIKKYRIEDNDFKINNIESYKIDDFINEKIISNNDIIKKLFLNNEDNDKIYTEKYFKKLIFYYLKFEFENDTKIGNFYDIIIKKIEDHINKINSNKENKYYYEYFMKYNAIDKTIFENINKLSKLFKKKFNNDSNLKYIKSSIENLIKINNSLFTYSDDIDDKTKGGNNDDFINLKEQIIDFYNNDIILKYIYNNDQIILFNYLNYIISKNKNIELLLSNKYLTKLITKDFINNLVSKIKIKLNLDLDIINIDKNEELFELKHFFNNDDIIIEGFDNFINYLFIYILSVKNKTNNIIINNNIYNLDNIPTLNIYNIPNKKIIILMSNEEEELSYELLNNKELLLDFIYEKFNYLNNEKKEFNNNYSYKINDDILIYLNKINDNHYQILNKLKEIEMKLNKIDKIDIYGGANNDDKDKDDKNKEDIKSKAIKFINNSIKKVSTAFNDNIGNKFVPKETKTNSNSTINRIVNKYDKSSFPSELKQYEFYNSVKNNNLDPAIELELTSTDKYIFIVVAYIIRFITLYICYYYINTDVITDIKYSIYYYLVVYIFIFVIAVIIINFDTFKLRILINYMNLHINTSGIFTHIILISLFVYLIYLLINNVIGLEQPPTQLTENQKIKLKYKLDILTLIIYGFICVFVLVF